MPAAGVLASAPSNSKAASTVSSTTPYDTLRLVNTAEHWYKLKHGRYASGDELTRSFVLPKSVEALRSSGVVFSSNPLHPTDAVTGWELQIKTNPRALGYIAWIRKAHDKSSLCLATDQSGVIYKGHLARNLHDRDLQSLRDLLRDSGLAHRHETQGRFAPMLNEFAFSIMGVQFSSCTNCCSARCCCNNGDSACCVPYNNGSCFNLGCYPQTWCCCCLLAAPGTAAATV
jgi:hypothetical protein